MDDIYDLVVIGAGPAGEVAAELAASFGRRALVVELYGKNQRSLSALRQLWRWLTFRSSETAPMHGSLHRAVEHRAHDLALAIHHEGHGNQNGNHKGQDLQNNPHPRLAVITPKHLIIYGHDEGSFIMFVFT